MTQQDANSQALSQCEAGLRNANSQVVGGQRLYNFGNKSCELYQFRNATLNLPDPTPIPAAAPIVAPVAPLVSEPAPTTPAQSPVPQTPTAPVATPVQVPPAPPAGNLSSAPVPTVKSGGDVVQKMKDLDSLFKQGLITREDYDRKKKQFLDEM